MTGYQSLIDGLRCDPKDRHVLAAAVRANSGAIITFNTIDFPDHSTDPYAIEIIDPDTGKTLGEGEPGEIVFTPLTSRGSVVLRYRTGDLISGGLTYLPCPGCGRTTSTYFQELAESIQGYVRSQMLVWREEYDGVENMTLAVMGCVVNGPGESKHANIGISLPGSGERPVAPVYVDGQKSVTLKGDNIAGEFRQIVDEYVQTKYPKKSVSAVNAH